MDFAGCLEPRRGRAHWQRRVYASFPGEGSQVVKRSEPPTLFLLAPQMYGSWGGVQTYMRRLREILCSYADVHQSNCRSISLVDECERAELHAYPVRHERFRYCSGSKFGFIWESLAAVWANRGGFAVVGHIGLAPIALLLRQAG